ncbi:MAG: Beta-lactamase [Gemmatimonadetes bacterium]|nr:Beta-lactamase [Gemmatimonadota bacterium]
MVEGDTIRFGTWRFVAHSTPGHTPGCTTWSTTLHSHGRALDAQFLCSTSVPGYTRLVNNADYPSIAKDYAATFSKLARLPCSTFFHEHPQGFQLERKIQALQDTPGVYPFTDPGGCRTTIAGDMAQFKRMLAKQTAAPVAPRD